jgi:hypothetical protein
MIAFETILLMLAAAVPLLSVARRPRLPYPVLMPRSIARLIVATDSTSSRRP